jgi:copper(I)-binding protein
MKNVFKSIAALLLMFTTGQCVFATENVNVAQVSSAKKEALDIKVTNAFFYLPLGASKTTMAFFTITNNSNTNVNVTGVSSQAAKQLRLMPESTLVLPAKQSVALKSSGSHVQINDLKTRLSTGDELHLEVSLSNGQRLHVIALAKSAYDQVHGR